MRNKLNILWTHFKEQSLLNFTSIRFYVISSVYLVMYFSIFTYSVVTGKDDITKWNNAVTASGIVTFALVLFILLFKWGFLERTIEKMKSGINSSNKSRIEYRAKKMNETERRIFLENNKKKEIEKENKPTKSNYPFYFNLIIYSLSLILIAVV
ncbi:hypothetical protein [Mycoplasma sp. OR1901]|uniref:hypothetical protein n=1 Tax=Mycoplasma sp. OR1901 TaxID=2742195 RepID=UPI0015831AC7|nr:hypothetical protein [Mycoplasma sp. OR1901]QKT05620.1 hypothetical protein HTZ87_02845 [Mycoplasma sp. OR1901]